MMAVRNGRMPAQESVVHEFVDGQREHVGDFVRRQTCGDPRLHGEVGFMPERDKLGKRKRPEATAEVVVVDDELRRKRIDLRGLQFPSSKP